MIVLPKFLYFLIFLTCLFLIPMAFADTEISATPGTVALHAFAEINAYEQLALAQMTEDEKEWYGKFLNGTLIFNGWNEISEDILNVLPDYKRTDAAIILKRLGVQIGAEWCRDNAIRRIDNANLEEWGDRFHEVKNNGPEVVLATLKEVEQEVAAILAVPCCAETDRWQAKSKR